MDLSNLIIALAPAFAAGFAVQRLLEIADPVLDMVGKPRIKHIVAGVISLIIGLLLAFGAGLHVLEPLGIKNQTLIDGLVTGLIVSGGTEGFNSIMKFLGYAKDAKSAAAGQQNADKEASAG